MIINVSKEDKPDVPILSKHQHPIKWVDYLKDCLYCTYGVCNWPFLYVIRNSVNTSTEVEYPLQVIGAYGSSGSILDELIYQLSHNHRLFKFDNDKVYYLLWEATRVTVYMSTISNYERRKDVRSVWTSIIYSHAGQDRWEKM